MINEELIVDMKEFVDDIFLPEKPMHSTASYLWDRYGGADIQESAKDLAKKIGFFISSYDNKRTALAFLLTNYRTYYHHNAELYISADLERVGCKDITDFYIHTQNIIEGLLYLFPTHRWQRKNALDNFRNTITEYGLTPQLKPIIHEPTAKYSRNV